ncbi:hypothetical protein N7456_012164 [Penicillium angulare]|uniref:Heterokaryon incompatibility domain-containing protein n=1 Tax=Penicillium angulare TaxID=116970 RepID=A0A9W9EV24_9EURO|nr:hypothetical protein N7456_012164 [Penicillium angulare]
MKELLDEAFRLCDPTENQSSYLPTRLIEVGSDTQSPRLVASQEEVSNSSSRSKGKPPGFIALSYCWGPEQQASAQLKTTSENLHEHLQNIPLEKLPATISDAILVCRALDIQYIWVDALCIIQDDEHDWEKEAANMGKVYSNALVTIAVTTGDSCQSGFVKRRSVPCINIPFRSSLRPEISGEFLIRPLPSDEEVSFSIYTDNGFDVQELLDPNWQKDEFKFANFAFDNFAVDIEESAWNSRAWTFQETRLSPRILLFGDSMFHLSVGDFFQSEDGVQKDDIGLWGDDTSDSSDESEEEADEDSREADFQRKWESLVWSYSERSLTFQRDKLIAFSAIASHASTQTKGQYLAGLWSENLHRGLLWGHFGTDTTQKYLDPSREYTAPSWSWASQPDLVKWISDYDRTAKTEMEVLSWNTTVGMDPYGRVRDGHIKILAKVCPIPATNIRHEIMSLGMTFPFELLSSEGEYLAQIRVDWRNQSDVAPVDPVTKEEKEDGPIERLFMVLIASRPYKESEMPSGEGKNRLYSDCLVQGLLLLPSENGNEYRRVGLFVSESRDLGGPRFWENIEMKEITLI